MDVGSGFYCVRSSYDQVGFVPFWFPTNVDGSCSKVGGLGDHYLGVEWPNSNMEVGLLMLVILLV